MGMSQAVKKIAVVAIVVNLAAGCAPLHPSGCHKTTATGNCGSGRWDDRDEWGAQALLSAGFDKVDYCTVRDANSLLLPDANTQDKRALAAAWINHLHRSVT